MAKAEMNNVTAGIYKKIENGIIGGYNKVENLLGDQYLMKGSKSIDEAKRPIIGEKKTCEIKCKTKIVSILNQQLHCKNVLSYREQEEGS